MSQQELADSNQSKTRSIYNLKVAKAMRNSQRTTTKILTKAGESEKAKFGPRSK